jgi:NADH:ubiquinone oxidoreductase subunit F (NADH-binding)
MAPITEQPLPRLLQGIGELPMARLDSHLQLHGPLPDLRGLAPSHIIELAGRAGLCGRGGAAFPAATKMRAVAARSTPKILVANGSEGEPASRKDRVLLRELPHLVLDGAALAARAIGADDAIIAFSETNERTAKSLVRALRERREARLRDPKFELVGIPKHWLSGQETALVNVLNGGPVKPTFGARPFERGVARRSTLVQNVETLAHLALIARHGPAWFRVMGGDRAPGSTLVTLSGALAAPGVYEIDPEMALEDLLESAGVRGELRAVLLGGYFGTWLPARSLPGLRLDAEHLAAHHASLGAGVIVALDETACPVAETTRIADYFASQTAGQCGPCVNGLDAIAYTIQTLATGTDGEPARADLARWFAELPGRGACQHPTGAVRFLASALRVFADEFAEHARHGQCERCGRAPVLPTPLVHAYALS